MRARERGRRKEESRKIFSLTKNSRRERRWNGGPRKMRRRRINRGILRISSR